jgi:pimeloyl-ACP methyl ester carboxylesterase
LKQHLFRVTIICAVLGVFLTSGAACIQKEGGQLETGKLVTKKVHVNDIDIAYRESGTGYPLILIMGFSGTMDLWSPGLISNLSQNHRLIMFDNRGMGATSSSDREYSIKLFADDTEGLMRALNIEKANVLGWSMGTYIAQELVLNYPDKVNRLILYAADVGGDKAIYDPQVVAQLSDTSGTDREKGERLLKLIFSGSWLKENPDPRKYMQTQTEQILPESIKKQTAAIGKWAGTFGRLPQIKVPVLLIAGTEDVIVPPRNSLMMIEKIPAAWLIQIKGGGHGLMFQYPERLAKIANFFLSDQ